MSYMFFIATEYNQSNQYYSNAQKLPINEPSTMEFNGNPFSDPGLNTEFHKGFKKASNHDIFAIFNYIATVIIIGLGINRLYNGSKTEHDSIAFFVILSIITKLIYEPFVILGWGRAGMIYLTTGVVGVIICAILGCSCSKIIFQTNESQICLLIFIMLYSASFFGFLLSLIKFNAIKLFALYLIIIFICGCLGQRFITTKFDFTLGCNNCNKGT